MRNEIMNKGKRRNNGKSRTTQSESSKKGHTCQGILTTITDQANRDKRKNMKGIPHKNKGITCKKNLCC